VKNLANDFRVIPTYIYAFQDKFKALPGDDASVTAHVSGATAATTPGTVGNGVIEGTGTAPRPPTSRSSSGSTFASPTSPRVRPPRPTRPTAHERGRRQPRHLQQLRGRGQIAA
jgi:hypothetical protein